MINLMLSIANTRFANPVIQLIYTIYIYIYMFV